MEKLLVGVCKGRHEMPCENYVFEKEVNPLDIRGLKKEAHKRLIEIADTAGIEYRPALMTVGYNDCYTDKYYANCVIYVTGLTVAVIAVLEAAVNLFVEVTLMHFDKEGGGYYPQEFNIIY